MILATQVAFAVCSLLLIPLVLAQKSSGGGLSSMFGAGVATGLSGSAHASRNLTRLTALMATLWLGCALTLLVVAP